MGYTQPISHYLPFAPGGPHTGFPGEIAIMLFWPWSPSCYKPDHVIYRRRTSLV